MKRLALGLSLAASMAFSTGAFAADSYKFDPSHSQILFSYNHLGFSTTYGLFSGFNGEAVIDADDLSKSSVKLEMKASDMITGWQPRTDHFMSGDFFNAAENPVVTFVSTKVEPTGEKTATITGDLTMAGQTKEVVLEATLNQIAEHPMEKKPWAGFDATTTLKRSDFGVDKFAPYVSDDVEIRISVEMEKTGEAS